MAGSMRRVAFPLVAGVVLVAVAIVAGVTTAGHTSTLNAQKSELRATNAQVETARAAAEDIGRTTSLLESGANGERIASDTKIVKELAERVLTWDSHASYEEARASTMRAYALGEDSPFMKAFLPPAPVNRDEQGNEYPYIDAAKLNSRVAGTTVKLLSVDGLDYSYLALVDVQSTSSDGAGKASNVATIFVTIDGDAAVTDAAGFASTTPPISSR